MAEQPLRIDELTSRTPLGTDYLPTTPTGGPSGRATVAEIVSAGLPAGQAATDILAWSTGTNTWAPLPVDLLVQSGLPQGHHQADLLAWSTATNRWAPLPFAPFAVNIAAGAAGSIPYQTAADHTAMLPIGTAGQVLTVGAGGPKWHTISDLSFNIATLATNADVDDSSFLCGSFSNWDENEYIEIPINCAHVKLDGLLTAKTINIQDNMGGAPNLQTFSAASLVSAGAVTFNGLSNLTQLNIPNLLECGGFELSGCDLLQRFDFPCHTCHGGIQALLNSALTNFSIQKVRTVHGGISVASNPNLKFFQLPYDLKLYGQYISLQDNALVATNGILYTVAQWDGKYGRPFWGGPGTSLNISGGTNAAPTNDEPFYGIDSAKALIARGCTVTVNGTAITTTKKVAYVPDFDTATDAGKLLTAGADGPTWEAISDKSFNIAQKSSIAADTFTDNSTISCMVYDAPGNPNFQAKEVFLNALVASGQVALQYSDIVEKFMAKSLTKVNGGIDVQNNSKLTNLYFPELTSITNNININNNALLSSLTLYSLKEAYGAVSVLNCPSITSLNLGTLYTVTNGIGIGVNSKLQNITLTSLQTLGGGIQLGGNALTVTAVNTLLSKAVGLVDPVTGSPWGYQRNFYIAGGTNAAPTGAGITAAQTLLARGCTVTVNGTAITTTKKTTFTIPDFDTVADKGKTLKVKADGTGLEWVA